MIPLPVVWSLVRRFWWLIPVTAILVTASVYRIQRDNAHEDLAAANAALAAQEARHAALVAHERRTTSETLNGLRDELARLRAAAAGPVPVVRLCGPTRLGEVPGVPTLAGGVRDSSAPGGSLPGVSDGTASEPGPDYGPGLYFLADRGDRCSAQVRHLLDRHRKLSELASALPDVIETR